MRQNYDVTMSHDDVEDVMCRRRRFENAKIGIWLCAFFACEYQPIVMKFSEIVYAKLSYASI